MGYVGKRRKEAGILLSLFMMLALAGCGDGQQAAGGNRVASSGSEQEETAAYQEILEGDRVPDFTAETADGDTFGLSEQSGKVVLLNFWATWCGPCVREMPAFEKLYGEYGQDIAILAVNCMEDKETVNQFISENGYTFPIAYDTEGTICRKYPSDGIPYTLVIGKDGTAKMIYLGAGEADEQYEEYKQAIEAALAENGTEEGVPHEGEND